MQILLLLILLLVVYGLREFSFQRERQQRRDYYRNHYLKSEAWKRKRFIVLKRDNWRCVFCGGHATQVHHKSMRSIT